MTAATCALSDPAKVQQNLENFQKAIEEREAVACNQKTGIWYIQNLGCRFVYWLFALRNWRLINVSRTFIGALNNLERSKVQLNDESYKKMCEAYASAGKALAEKLHQCNTKKTDLASHLLRRHIVALEYRAELILPDEQASETLFKKLMAKANKWESAQLLSPHDREWRKSKNEERIRELCRYKQYARLILKSSHLQEITFRWIIRSRNNANILVQYPYFHQKFRECLMAHRIGWFDSSWIRIFNDGSRKDLQMEFDLKSEQEETVKQGEERWVSILNEDKVLTLGKKGYSISIKKIFLSFKKKDKIWTRVETFRDGIHCWDSGRMCEVNNKDEASANIDLTMERWWEQLPKGKWTSLKELRAFYPEQEFDKLVVDGQHAIRVTMATRRQEKLVVQGTHAYEVIYIPEVNAAGEPGYQAFLFGKFPKEKYFPKSCCQFATFPAKTFPANIAYPDPNFGNAHRQHGGVPENFFDEQQAKGIDQEVVLEDAQFHEHMKKIAKDIQRGRDGEMVYNLFVQNCVGWASPKDKRHEYSLVLEDSEPMFPMNKVFKLIHRLPEKMQRGLYYGLFWVMGGRSKRECTTKSKRKVVVSILNDDRAPWHKAVDPKRRNPADLKRAGRKPEDARNFYLVPAAYFHGENRSRLRGFPV